ncbi:hypothetical protein [Croceibacterium mercuriale]|uniref:hypothetical protein n=1 Tax=Croceibacterium mercuriale TaxID=1572751 RepID=UPI001269F69D|nr:hypothetical protein [Croceibacterium mercuriale]
MIRAIGIAHAEAKTDLPNLAYNVDCLIFHDRRAITSHLRRPKSRSARRSPRLPHAGDEPASALGTVLPLLSTT